MKTRASFCTIAALLMLAVPEIASAGTIQADFIGIVNPGSVTTTQGTTDAGYFKWRVDSSSGLPFSGFNPGDNFYAFCIQWGQFTGQDVVFNVTSNLGVAPQGSPPANAMGAGAATALNRLFDTHFSPGPNGLNATQAQAFQLAVWEIVYEGINNTSNSNGNVLPTLNLQSGAFTATNASAGYSTAQTWLTTLYSTPVATNYGVYALTSSSNQDQVIGIIVNGGGDPNVTVPEPATMSLLAISGIGALAYRVRRRRGMSVVQN